MSEWTATAAFRGSRRQYITLMVGNIPLSHRKKSSFSLNEFLIT